MSFFPDTPPPAFYPLSLHDALPISRRTPRRGRLRRQLREGLAGSLPRQVPLERAGGRGLELELLAPKVELVRSEEHTSELQSQSNLVCRLLLEKKKKKKRNAVENIT